MSDEKLIKAAAQLSRMAPETWKEFLGAFALYAEKTRETCIQSPVDTLAVAQGQARACTRLLDLFVHCQSTAEKYEGKRK